MSVSEESYSDLERWRPSSNSPHKLTLPPFREAHEPPEIRGIARDQVRLMVSYRSDNAILHNQFDEIGHFLARGDVLAINTSGTMKASLPAVDANGQMFEVHLSTRIDDDHWTIELRFPSPQGSAPFLGAQEGQEFSVPGGGSLELVSRFQKQSSRIWVALISLPSEVSEYLDKYGSPIRYGYVPSEWDSIYYQTAYATEEGSAEMPSAGRPFTPSLIAQLVARGIVFAPLMLHTGVASLESDEDPYPEYYRVPAETAEIVNIARAHGRRIVAVGTTVVRALESVTDSEGVTWQGEGWTDLVVRPKRGVRSINGLLTGFHEPKSTHLAMLEAFAGREHVQLAYAAAVAHRYLWHEFGDLHLILTQAPLS